MSKIDPIEARRLQVRGWVNAIQDAARHLSSVAFRASEAFDSSEECVIFHELGVELGGLEKLSPAFDKIRLLGMERPPAPANKKVAFNHCEVCDSPAKCARHGTCLAFEPPGDRS